MRARRAALTGCLFVAALACAVRIRSVNRSELLEKYLPEEVILEAGEQVALSNAEYYVDVADLSGYHMEVAGTELVRTADFLEQYGVTWQDLEQLSVDTGTAYQEYGLLYLVTVKFWNEGWETPTDNFICLDNFLLVGTDFQIVPDTRSIHRIPGFNPELDGTPAFAIGSDRIFEVTIPYLIRTEGELAISETYLRDSDLKLLITVYPEEKYLKLEKPD